MDVSASASTTAGVPTRRGSARVLWSRYWPLLGLGVLAILVSVAVHHWIFPAYSWNRDEPVYLWQVKALRAGQILPTDGGMPAFFQPWLSGHGPGYFFSQYTLGWPLALLAGQVLLGTAASALALGALLTVLGTYAFARTVTHDHTLALVAAGVMLASPILAVQSGVYLAYLFTLGLGLLFGAALLTGVARRRPALLVAAGAMVGWIFMTRPFDAVLWAGAFVAYVVVAHWREWSRLTKAAGWVVLGALPLVIATLAYNKKVTGTFTEFPITAADPLDTFGFGLRRLMPTFGKDDYTVGTAVRSVGKNGVFLPLFLFGSYLGVAVAAFGLWLRRRQRSSLALILLMVAFPLGYFFFWGTHVSAATTTLSGPIYFMPLYASLAVLIASVIVVAWRHRRRSGALLGGCARGRDRPVRGEPPRCEPPHQRIAGARGATAPRPCTIARSCSSSSRAPTCCSSIPSRRTPPTSTAGSSTPPIWARPISISSRRTRRAPRTCSRRRSRRSGECRTTTRSRPRSPCIACVCSTPDG